MRHHECYSLLRVKAIRQDNNHAELAAIYGATLGMSEDINAELFTNSATCIRLLHEGSQDRGVRLLILCTKSFGRCQL
jgi:hypothetical protein